MFRCTLLLVRSIPRDFDEAALIGGSSVHAIPYRIILPLLKTVTVSVVILAGVTVWSDCQLSLYSLQKPATRVITPAISRFFAVSGSDAHEAAAAAIIAIVPITVIYICLQNYFVRGMVDGATRWAGRLGSRDRRKNSPLEESQMAKIAFLGAGSTVFAKNLLGDCMLTPALQDAEYALFNIDAGRLKDSQIMLERINQNVNGGRARADAHAARALRIRAGHRGGASSRARTGPGAR